MQATNRHKTKLTCLANMSLISYLNSPTRRLSLHFRDLLDVAVGGILKRTVGEAIEAKQNFGQQFHVFNRYGKDANKACSTCKTNVIAN